MSNIKHFLLMLIFTGERFVTYPTMVVSIKVKSIVNHMASTETSIQNKVAAKACYQKNLTISEL